MPPPGAARMPHIDMPSLRIIRVVYEVKREVNLTETLAIGPAMRTLEAGPAEGARGYRLNIGP